VNKKLFLDGLAASNSELQEFTSFKKMLDLGGGPGLVGIAIVASHLNKKGVIFDRPAIIKVAESFI